MAGKRTKSDRAEIHKWVVSDLAKAGLPVSQPGAHQALLSSLEMDRVWDLLRQHSEKFCSTGSAASLVFMIQGVLHGPHRTQLMSEKDRRGKLSRIDALCGDLAEAIASLRDDDLDLPHAIDMAIDDALDDAFESWERDVLGSAWTEAVLGVASALERQAGTRDDWTSLVEPDASGVRHVNHEVIRSSLSSGEAKASEAIVGFAMQMLKDDTQDWLHRSIKSGVESILWAMQDGVRSLASEPQIIHKPSDVSEQWAYVIRCVHSFLFQTFRRSMLEETAIVVRAVQDHSSSAAGESSTITASLVSGIISR